jgi:hypothetical protein
MTLSYESGGEGVHQFVLLKDGGSYKVCGDPF